MERLIKELKTSIKKIYPEGSQLISNVDPLKKGSYWFRPSNDSSCYFNICTGITDNEETFQLKILMRPKDQIAKFEKTFRLLGKEGKFGQNTDEMLTVTRLEPDYFAISEIYVSGKKLSSRMRLTGQELLTWGSLSFEKQ